MRQCGRKCGKEAGCGNEMGGAAMRRDEAAMRRESAAMRRECSVK